MYINNGDISMLLEKYLKDNLKLPIKALIYDEVSSTNTLCKELSKEYSEDIAVIALSQSGGKGRLGRSFFSPKNSGIYLSLLLHPKLSATNSTKITTAAAVAAAQAIDKISNKKSLIKWVNDLYLDGKKVCGILTEAAFSGNGQGLDYAILGIGVNLYSPNNGFPKDIINKAGSVFGEIKANPKAFADFLSLFINNFYVIYNELPQNGYMDEYRQRNMLFGKAVSFIRDGKEISATVEGIDDNAGIILKTENGLFTLTAGEVSLIIK